MNRVIRIQGINVSGWGPYWSIFRSRLTRKGSDRRLGKRETKWLVPNPPATMTRAEVWRGLGARAGKPQGAWQAWIGHVGRRRWATSGR